MPKKNSKFIYIFALALFVSGLGYLIYSGLDENSSYFLNVSEALAMPREDLSRARLFGTVSPDGLETPEGALGVGFSLADKDNGSTIRVDYHGAVPDTFKPGVEVIVEGGVDPSSGVFKASSLMTKCPSKYQKENRG